MKESITDNNSWISSQNNKPIRDDGSVVNENDGDAIVNPNFGVTTEIEHPDPPPVDAPEQPTKAQLLARIEDLLTAVKALKD